MISTTALPPSPHARRAHGVPHATAVVKCAKKNGGYEVERS
jgi:hypothetical protein